MSLLVLLMLFFCFVFVILSYDFGAFLDATGFLVVGGDASVNDVGILVDDMDKLKNAVDLLVEVFGVFACVDGVLGDLIGFLVVGVPVDVVSFFVDVPFGVLAADFCIGLVVAEVLSPSHKEHLLLLWLAFHFLFQLNVNCLCSKVLYLKHHMMYGLGSMYVPLFISATSFI